MDRGSCLTSLWLLAVCIVMLHTSTYAAPYYPSVYGNTRNKDYLVEVEDPDAVLEILATLGQNILKAQHEGTNAKRGLDLGLGRGFSGSQAAKHLMGLAAANFAAGPGKRKRMEEKVGPEDLIDAEIPLISSNSRI